MQKSNQNARNKKPDIRDLKNSIADLIIRLDTTEISRQVNKNYLKENSNQSEQGYLR